MKLDKTLNFKKVRCVKAYDDCLEIGKEYNVIDISVDIKVKDDRGELLYWESDYFEPVIDELSKSAENQLQDMKLTPELKTEASEPKFKAGDKVYRGLKGEIRTVERVEIKSLHFAEGGCDFINHCCPATQENYEKLCSLFECIDFEQPHKPLAGSDLTRAMVDKGWFIVDCYVSAISDEAALRFRNKRMQVALFGDGLFTDGVKQFPFAVPFDSKTGEPLTEAVLDEN